MIKMRCRGLKFDPGVGKISWRRKWQSTPVFFPREFHGQKSISDYSSWGCKGSDTTEAVILSLFIAPLAASEIFMKSCYHYHEVFRDVSRQVALS